ncbi:hypothetical protein T02_10894 [Trichinella nativa]|uniref:Uncharacterized protein n=1 Tax=Trichinella nativa TaxID=6335 RepID=A0A0V1KT45_9BILA|nr:hypothetical protein T02_10894 [Trichinella nativa]
MNYQIKRKVSNNTITKWKLFLNFTNFYETTECNQFAKRKLRYFVDSTNFMMTLKMIMASRIKILFYC